MNRTRMTGLVLGVGVVVLSGFLFWRGWHKAAQVDAEAAEPASAVVTAADGRVVYEQYCLACHATDARGIPGKYPDLTKVFAGSKDAYDKAYSFISRNMPQNAPGTLSDTEYKAVVKYVLSLNGIPTAFSDVDDHWAKKEIEDLLDRRYIDGYTSGEKLLFKPDQAITRADFVRFLVKTKELYLSNETLSDFADADKFKTDAVYIKTAVDNGLIDGFPDHTFRPDKPITRAEIAALLARSELMDTKPGAVYSDVPLNHWASGAIAAVSSAGLFGGYEDGSFRPTKAITRAEAAVVLDRLIHPNG